MNEPQGQSELLPCSVSTESPILTICNNKHTQQPLEPSSVSIPSFPASLPAEPSFAPPWAMSSTTHRAELLGRMVTQAASLLSMMALGDTGGHSVPAQPTAHPQPWGHPLVSFDIGDAEFWVTYYPEKTKVNFGWRYFRSGSSGRALGPSLCSGGTLGVVPGLEDPAQCPSGCGVIRAGIEMWDHKNPAWLCLPLSNCAPSSQSSLNVHLKFKTSRFSTQNILES